MFHLLASSLFLLAATFVLAALGLWATLALLARAWKQHKYRKSIGSYHVYICTYGLP